MPLTDTRTLDLDWSDVGVRNAMARIREIDSADEDTVKTSTVRSGAEVAACDRRAEQRQPLVSPAFLMPAKVIGSRAIVQQETPLPVVTLDLGPHGLGIQHDRQIPSLYSIVAFDLWKGGSVAVLVEKCWTESGNGTYRTGFRVMAAARD